MATPVFSAPKKGTGKLRRLSQRASREEVLRGVLKTENETAALVGIDEKKTPKNVYLMEGS